MDDGEVMIEHADTCRVLRAQARGVHRRALVTALMVTAVALMLP
jgi:hypothetical protein